MHGANLFDYRLADTAGRQEHYWGNAMRDFVEITPLFASVLVASVAFQLGAWVTLSLCAGLFCVIVLAAKI